MGNNNTPSLFLSLSRLFLLSICLEPLHFLSHNSANHYHAISLSPSSTTSALSLNPITNPLPPYLSPSLTTSALSPLSI